VCVRARVTVSVRGRGCVSVNVSESVRACVHARELSKSSFKVLYISYERYFNRGTDMIPSLFNDVL
jgi:hypothetical protein